MARPRRAPPRRPPPPAPSGASCGGRGDDGEKTRGTPPGWAGTTDAVIRSSSRIPPDPARMLAISSKKTLEPPSRAQPAKIKTRERRAGWESADLGHDLGRDQLQVVQIVQVEELQVHPGRAEGAEHAQLRHDL